MTDLPPSASRALAGQAVVSAALTLAHSLRARGPGRTLLFAGLGVGLPVFGEYMAVNVVGVLRHRTGPKFQGVPLAAALGWYNIGYATFATLESVFAPLDISPRLRRVALPIATALVATSLDLLMDCYGLDQGLWEWNVDGPYAPDIAGPNGHQGIPIDNFTGWLLLTSTVTLLYLLLSGDTAEGRRAGDAGSARAGRTAALLLLPYYLGALAWATQRRKWRFILYSALTPIVLGWALWRRTGDR